MPLTVSHLLGALEEEPHSETILADLRTALQSGDPSRTGEAPMRLIASAREQHEQRGEYAACVGLLLVEAEQASGDPDARAKLFAKASRLQREELLDDEGGKKSLEQAVELRPGDDDLKQQIEQISAAEGNWKDIAKRFVDESESASDASLKTSLLVSAGSLVWKYKKRGRDKDADRVFKQALEADSGDPRATRLYAHILRSREKWDDLASVLLESAEHTKSPSDRLHFFLEAARVVSRQIGQKDRAAACYERVLDLAPGHAESMAFLVEHFTAQERWDHLVALYDDALRGRLKPEAEQGILLQLGMVHWRLRNNAASAEPHFARLRKLDPVHPGMLAFYRDYLTSTEPAKLLTILGDAQRITQDPKQKAALGVELARAAQASGATDKAIDAWKAVQKTDPTNADALPALRELYRQSQKWNALVEILRAEADALPAADVDGKAALLRETVGVYRDHLKLDVMTVNTWTAILALRPNDQEALDALVTTYGSMGRWNDLIQVLSKKADASEDREEQVSLQMRIAKLWIDRFANYNQATRPLEIVIEKEPSHREALNLLKEIYTKRRAWKQLFDVMSAEASLVSDPDVRQAHRIELARLAADRLHRPTDAIPLWKQVLDTDAENKEALDSLEKLAEREKDWTTLAEVIERRVSATLDEKEQIRLLSKLAGLYGEQLNDGALAASGWKRVLKIDPKNGKALRTLRESYVQAGDWTALEELYGETNDWEGLAEVLGNAAERATEVDQKVDLSFRAAGVYENRIREPQRAFRAYERVLSVRANDERAAKALVPIYTKDEKWSRLPALYDVLVGHSTETSTKLSMLATAREIAADRLNDGALATRYATDAFRVAPSDTAVRTSLEATARKTGTVGSVVQAYEQRLTATTAASELEERQWLRKRIADLSIELADTDKAAGALRAILAEAPQDSDATAALDQLLRRSGRHGELRAHYLQRIELASDPTDRWMLLSELGRLEEAEFGDATSAAAHYREALVIEPTDRDLLAALDRLATQGERWEELLGILTQRRALASDADARDLSLRAAELQLERVPDLAAAKSGFADVLRAEPSSERAIAGLERLRTLEPASADEVGRILEPAYESTGAFDKLRDVVVARLAVTTDAGERRALQLRQAELTLGPLGDAAGAYATLESAFLDQPSDHEVIERLAHAAEASGKEEQFAQALATAIEMGELAKDDELALASRAARVFGDLGRPAEAEPFHRRILGIDPAHAESFAALKETYTDGERWQELQELYRARIAQTLDAQSKLDLLLQLCFVFEELIDDPQNAIRAYRDVLEIDPRHVASRRSLDALYTRTEQWRDLAELLRGDIEDATDEGATALLVRIGELYETKLRDPKEAVDAYESALGRSPEHAEARAALERLLADPTQRQRIASILEPIYEMHDDFAGLARSLEVQLEFVTEPNARVDLLKRIAELHTERLGQWSEAMGAYLRAVPLAPGDTDLREKLALATRACAASGKANAYEERASALEAALKTNPGTDTENEIVRELATLWDDEAGDATRAEPWLERAYVASASDPEMQLQFARSLERIHLGSGQDAKLAEALRRQVALESSDDAKAHLLVRLATLQEERIGDVAGAIQTHAERVELNPGDMDALRSLERLYTGAERWVELRDVLERLDQASTSESDQRGFAMRAAELTHGRIGDQARAISQYTDILGRFGASREALLPLVEIYQSESRWPDLVDALEQLRAIEETDDARADVMQRVGDLQRTKLGERERAVETYGQVLELVPSHAAAREALRGLTLDEENRDVRLAAARLIRPLDEAQGPTRALLGTLDVLATNDDPIEKLEALRRGAAVAEALGDNAGAYERAASAVRAGIDDADLNVLIDEADRLASGSEKWLEHGVLLEDVAPSISDADLQVEALRRLAVIKRDKLEDAAGARETFQQLLEQRPDDGDALVQLEQLVERGEDWPALLDLLSRRADLATGAERAALLRRQADVCESKLNDIPKAIDALDQVLSENDSPEVYASLERLYTSSARWSDLVSLYERMLERGVGQPVDVRYRLGRVYETKLNDTSMAIEQYKDALVAGDAHAPTVAALEALMESTEHRAAAAAVLEPVYLARLQWPKVQRALEARIASEDDPDARKTLLGRLGQLHEDYLEDLDGAFAVYVRLFREDPRVEGTWDVLTRLSRVLEKWERLADTYRATLEDVGVDDESTYKLALLGGEIYETRTTHSEHAIALYRLAHRFAADDSVPFMALERLYTQRKEWSDLLRVYRDRVDGAGSDAERLSLLQKSADLERDRLNDADLAIASYRAMLDIDPTQPVAIDALGSLLTVKERWTDLADLLRLRIEHAVAAEDETPLKAQLAALQATHLSDVDGSIDTYEEILRVQPSHSESLQALEARIVDPAYQMRIIRILEPIYEITDQWKKQIALHEAEAGWTEEPSEKVRLLSAAAKLHEERGRNANLAFSAYARAFSQEPANEEVRENVDRLAAASEDWNGLVVAYEAAVAQSTDPAVTASLLSSMARIHDEKRGDPRAAIQTFERLVALDPNDPSPLDALEALHTMVGDWRGMAATLEKKVERSYDPAERGELLRRAGSVAEDLLGDRDMAVDFYKRAVNEDDSDVIAYESLDRLYAEADDYKSLSPVLERRLELESDGEIRGDVALRLGQLAETHLREPELAVRAFQQALIDRPGDVDAVAALTRLYEQQSMWPELLENLKVQAAGAESSEARVGFLFRAAEILERELDDMPEAIATHDAVLAIHPRHEASIQSLLRVARLEEYREQASQTVMPFLEAQGRWDDIATMTELVVESSRDPMEKQQHLRRLAQVHEGGRNDKAAAFEATKRALAEDASDTSLVDQLERLGGELGEWERLADVLSARAGSAMDAEVSNDLLGRLARIAEGQLKDDARAIDAHRRRLSNAPDDETSLAALDRLYAKSESWNDLAEVLDRRAQMENDPTQRNEFLIRLGALRWEHFGNTAMAFEAFRDVLDRDPSEPRALAAMEGLLADERLAPDVVNVLDVAYRTTGSTAKSASLYDVRIRLADSDGERVRLLSELAQLRENDLGDVAGALTVAVRAYELDPRDEALLGEVERLAGASSKFDALRGLAEKVAGGDELDATAKRDLYMRAASWYRDRLGDREHAERVLESALAADREHTEAHDQLIDLRREPGREESLVASLMTAAEVDLDETKRVERLLEAARLAESARNDSATARRAYELILDRDPAHAGALDELIRLAVAEQRWSDAASLLDRRIDIETDPTTRVAQRRQLALITRDKLTDTNRAIECWQAVLDEVPTDLEAISALEALFEKQSRYRDLEDLVQRRLDIAETDAERLAGRVRLARLADLQGRRSDAIDQLREILEEAPENSEALDALEALYLADKRFGDLAASLESRADSANRSGQRDEELRLLTRLADAKETALGDAAGATSVWERVLSTDAQSTAALSALPRLYRGAGRNAEAADAYRALARASSGAAASAAWLEVAALAEGSLNDADGAEAALREALASSGGDNAIREQLRAFFERTKRHAGRAELLAEDAERTTDKPAQIALFKQVADLYAQQLNDPGRAANALERAVSLDPEDRAALLPLCDLYIAAGRQSDAIPVLEKIIASYGTRRAKEVATYHHRLGQAYEGMGKNAEALASFDAAFKIDLTSVAILRDLGRICYTTGDWDRAQKTFRALLLQKLDANSGITKGDVYFYLGDITAKQGDPKKAITMLDRALVEQPGHPAAVALLAQLKS